MKKQTPETAIKNEVRDYLRFNGWFVFYVLQGMGAYKGVSDLIACKGGVVLFIEIKTKKGRQSDHQIRFESDIKESGCHYLIARGYEEVSKYIEGLEGV